MLLTNDGSPSGLDQLFQNLLVNVNGTSITGRLIETAFIIRQPANPLEGSDGLPLDFVVQIELKTLTGESFQGLVARSMGSRVKWIAVPILCQQ
jgi:hypothetical protein